MLDSVWSADVDEFSVITAYTVVPVGHYCLYTMNFQRVLCVCAFKVVTLSTLTGIKSFEGFFF